jgi:hypothetical protein
VKGNGYNLFYKLSQILCGGIEENYEKHHSIQLITGPGFEPR